MEPKKISSETTARQQFVADLREMADFYERTEAEMPGVPVNFNLFSYTREELAQKCRYYGAMSKQWSGDWFYMEKRFGKSITVQINAPRTEVCQKVKVGQRVVPALPAREAQPERVEDVYEWQCDDGPLLAKPKPEISSQPAGLLEHSSR